VLAREEERLRSHGIPYEVRCLRGNEIDAELTEGVRAVDVR